MEEKENIFQEQIESALADENLPRIYFNGFITSLATGDVFIVLKQNEKPVAILNVSHIVAKSLATKLANIIALLEEKTGSTIMTTDDVLRKLVEDVDNDTTDE
ncbi:MAG: hypothetical protein GY864_12050 [Desulfobacterales bacterium]|nr:hypothetical protein [Desulfobacterales bacterium]